MITALYVCSNVVDDEEEMLYGDANTSNSHAKDELTRNSAGALGDGDVASSKAEPSHWCMIIRESGVMEVRTELHLRIGSYEV